MYMKSMRVLSMHVSSCSSCSSSSSSCKLLDLVPSPPFLAPCQGMAHVAPARTFLYRMPAFQPLLISTYRIPLPHSCSPVISRLSSDVGRFKFAFTLLRSRLRFGYRAQARERRWIHLCWCADQDQESLNVSVEGNGAEQILELNHAFEDGWQWKKTNRELVAYGILLAAVPAVPLLPRFEWSGAIYFFFLALWSVYVGSHRSLGRDLPQRISLQQGLAAPFISVASNLVEPVRFLFPKANSLSWQIYFPEWLVQDEGHPVHMTVTMADWISLFVGIGVAIASKQAGAPFTLTNLIAVCIVTELLQLISLGSFVTAVVMLGGLLIYDVFWVFGSSHVLGDNVMVTVATSTAFDGPVKLIFPQWKENIANPYSVLGLGDLAAPGLLIALMLRFDYSRSRGSILEIEDSVPVMANLTNDKVNKMVDKTYFITCMASYVSGLALTVVANSISGAAQPALLYLVPSLFFGVFLMAALRSEETLLLQYKDEAFMRPTAGRKSEEVPH
eukprot:c26934_g1_i5 orf=142-1647(+)